MKNTAFCDENSQRTYIKGAWSYFSKFSFLFSFEESSLQRCESEFSVELVNSFGCTKQICIFQLPISYCVSFIMVTITRHIFTGIFQMERFLAVKFAMAY